MRPISLTEDVTGTFTNEGPTHLRQRTILHIAFRNLSIEHLEPAFFNKAEALADRWTEALSLRSYSDEICCRSVNESQKDSAVIDVGEWMSRASFDAMGLASFNFDFRTIQNESEDVYDAYRQRLAVMDKGVGIWGTLNSYLPIIRNTAITRDIRIMNTSLRTIDTTVKSIVAQTKAAMKGVSAEQDLFASLIESNLSVGQSDRLADATLLEQCSTLLLTGSDTVSVALSWCLHFLANYPEVQARLRDELYDSTSCEVDDMSDTSSDSGYEEHCVSCKAKTMQMAMQMAMPYKCSCHLKGARWKAVSNLRYLDSVVRETLRLCPPIQNIVRVATCDDTIPLFFPVSLANGTTRRQDTGYIPIRKGSYVHIPIDGLNQCEDIWGPDAAEFRPSRWETATLPSLPSVDYPLSFGMGNHHSCLGHRLALAHIKIFLATLLPRFEFNPAEGIEISKFGSTLTRPYVQGKWSDGSQLPLRVRKLQ
ncbi:hypothetical protein D9613_002033 [Agrocybe pediades]|uniref:Cytochrome P450 n=1 Tax=Agrocybe pediades TaxID=84607 RepID=A0A8H4VXC0_9AGAR|nr:hypothetical protein D9613_002033 [Agrocybe pediades]